MHDSELIVRLIFRICVNDQTAFGHVVDSFLFLAEHGWIVRPATATAPAGVEGPGVLVSCCFGF
jgi:hypothetical protein